MICLLAGAAFSPAGFNLLRPGEYADDEAGVGAVTLPFTRLVLGIQLTIAGVQLPKKYIARQWRPLAILVILDMTLMWLTTSTILWLVLSDFPFVHALAVGSCVTPTDPILSNVIVQGRFADQNLPRGLRRLVVAESGINDGFGYPFLFIALYLIYYTGAAEGGDGSSPEGGAMKALGLWFLNTWGYTILLSVIYGVAAGYVAKMLLHWATGRGYIDKEHFMVYAVSLSIFILGTCGMAKSDDVLACFIAGNVLTWDDYFRQETEEDSFQPTIDMLLNVSIFMWFGAVCPWYEFAHSDLISIYELIGIGILVLAFRRLPWIVATYRFIPQITSLQESLFVGFFGPIGVSAIFYLYILVEYIDERLTYNEEPREDVRQLKEAALLVVWFLTVCSIVGASRPQPALDYSLTFYRWLTDLLSRLERFVTTHSPTYGGVPAGTGTGTRLGQAPLVNQQASPMRPREMLELFRNSRPTYGIGPPISGVSARQGIPTTEFRCSLVHRKSTVQVVLCCRTSICSSYHLEHASYRSRSRKIAFSLRLGLP